MPQSQPKVKVYLDDSGNPVKPSVDNSTLDTAPSLKINQINNDVINPNIVNQLETTNRAKLSEVPAQKSKIYLDDSGEPISENTETPKVEPKQGWGTGLTKGLFQGTVLDLPETIMGIPGAIKTSMGPLGDMIFGGDSASDLTNTIKGIPSGLKSMYDTTMQAGKNPEEFGRMVGNVIGQPLLTAGLVKGVKPTIRTGGRIAEPVGRLMRKHQPLTGMPIISPFAGRNLQKLERYAGKEIEKIGQKMQSVGTKSSKSSKLMDDILTNENLADDFAQLSKPTRTGRSKPPSKIADQIVKSDKPAVRLNPDGTYTRFDTGEIVDSTGRPMASPINSSLDNDLKTIKNSGTITPSDLGNDPKLINNYARYLRGEIPDKTNFKDLSKLERQIMAEENNLKSSFGEDTTGAENALDNLDSQFNREIKNITPTKVPKELTIKNAPPNQRAKIMRGQHDAVDILFDNANDRRVFGAGQNMFLKGEIKPGLAQTWTDITTQVAKEYGLPIEKARELVSGYNRRLRELSKDMPKYGDELNFKAPSFETFMDSALRGKQKSHPLDIVKKETGSVTIRQGSDNPYKKNKVDTPISQENPGIESYADELLAYTSNGEPGVSIKDMTPSIKDATKFRKDYEIAYRNPNGKPIAVARYRAYPDGIFDVTDLALDKSSGLLQGKAINSIVDKLQEMGITNVTGSVSPEFLKFVNKKLKSKSFTDQIN